MFTSSTGVRFTTEPLGPTNYPFIAAGSCALVWKYCRLDTGIDIPDGWRLADTEKESFDKRAKYLSFFHMEWRKTVNTAWDKSLAYVVPLEKVEPKYRPFESFEEWWPHRERWVRNRYGNVEKMLWCNRDRAKTEFEHNSMFLNDDGTTGEPFGVRVE